ncbi:Copper chaperone PCu(A)C [Rhodovastum atsumiense]|uniref:Copper chaperone PCu(A)C n=1 Tax=Rhodovastum atsumiense TaxID=504468 RepID=A0A5M6IRP3_9PROT|nr:copper chaperone PCu(A)C [Rhodovastum atsumiense]KAA5610579.1 copper chaperone PCu(A)C [Rhodovastum atsumiense]CAH2600690.1 Copper chaperone PCu(A)C [Rhodovastum atsumiense]
MRQILPFSGLPVRVAVFATLLIAAAPAWAQTAKVTQPWARATAPNAQTGAAFVTVEASGAPDRLTGGSSPVAGKVEVHEHIHDNGVMRMREVAGGLALEPGKPVTLQPGSYHLMLMGLKQQLKPGESFPLTLTFAKAPPVTVTVAVAAAGASAPPAHAH